MRCPHRQYLLFIFVYGLNLNLSFESFLEYLGGLVPLLKGKKTSKIRPEFVIFDPQVSSKLAFDIQSLAKCH